MATFIIGILILIFGYIFYSKYIEKQFGLSDEQTPAYKINDNLDYIPLSLNKNKLIHLLNIAGLGPILGAIQGILFGPVAFIIIPLGCILMGCVHDYFAGMLSVRNNGAQITELIKKYLGQKSYAFFMVVVSIMLIMLAAVFVFTSGDIIAQRFFNQSDFSITNPTVAVIYVSIALYYIMAALFPIDKIIGRFYPFFGFLLIFGTLLILLGFFFKGIELQNINFSMLNEHPKGLPLVPMFFITVSCGLLSGFHSTQATIVSRTLSSEKDGRKVFFKMMVIESLIAMIWAAAAMYIYNFNLIAPELYGSVNVINKIADVFINPYLVFVVTLAVVILPITSGDTALRGLRMIIAEAFKFNQTGIKNRLVLITPVIFVLISIILWAKTNSDSFSNIWKYFNFTNQLIAIPTFLYASVYLYKNKKNYYITLLPGLFYVFITSFFLLYSNIGLNINYKVSIPLAFLFTIVVLIAFRLHYINKAG